MTTTSESFTPLFTTKAERENLFAQLFSGDRRLGAFDAFRQAIITGWVDTDLIRKDVAALVAAAIYQEHPDLTVTREAIAETPTFTKAFRAARWAAELVMRQALGQKNNPSTAFTQAGLPAPEDTQGWEKILRQIAEEDESKEQFRHVELLDPKEAWNLAQQLVGKTIRFNNTDRRSGDFPAFGPKTQGEVTQVTESQIHVEWDDGRQFNLEHGRDQYEIV